MILFLTTFFLLYGALHLYAFMKVKAAFAPGVRAGFFIALLMVAMTVAPLIIRLLEKQGHETLARFFSYAGYTWMGVLLLFFVTGIALDLYRLCVHGAVIVLQRDLTLFLPSPRSCFVIPLVVALSLAAYGYFEAQDIRIEKFTLRTPKISPSAKKITIAQISDVHLGLIVREERLKKILEKVESEKPDILISTGDLVDGQINNLSGLVELLQRVKPRYGKYAVTGNHEFYAGLPQALEFTKQAGFTLLRGRGVTVAGLVNLAGVDDPAGIVSGFYRGVYEKNLLSRLPRDKFTILIKHLPIVDESALGLFDLQISGHTHQGQIFPFRYMTRLSFRYNSGWFDLPEKSRLYVSRGTGTWGPPIRFLSPPEVTIFELLPEE
jgi:predicted MPP superfamily phosphohydrolase